MIKLDDLRISLPDSWVIHPFESIILGKNESGNLGRLQILLGYKDEFTDFPSHGKCVDIMLKSMLKETLPDDSNNIFQETHDKCCLVGAFAYTSEKYFERIYYKYINNKFIVAIYSSEKFHENKDGVLGEVDESDSIIESIYFDNKSEETANKVNSHG